MHIRPLAIGTYVFLCLVTAYSNANAAPPAPAAANAQAPLKTDATTSASAAGTKMPDTAGADAQPAEIVQKQMASTDLMKAAIEKQRVSAQSQLGAATAVAPGGDTFFTTTWTTPAVLKMPNPMPSCTALEEEDLKPLVDASSKAHNLQAELVRAVIKRESASYPCAISDKGAVGLMQLMPEVAQQMAVDPLDPKQNVDGGSKYLKQLLDRYKGDVRLALAAYNAGPQRVDTDKKVPDIPETVAYVDAILKDLTQTPAPKN